MIMCYGCTAVMHSLCERIGCTLLDAIGAHVGAHVGCAVKGWLGREGKGCDPAQHFRAHKDGLCVSGAP